MPDDEPLLKADFPLPGSFQLPTVIGTPFALARLNPTPSSAAKSLGTALPVVSSSRAGMLDAVSPLAGKRRGHESMSDAESSGVAESPCASTLAIMPFTPDDFFYFFFGLQDSCPFLQAKEPSGHQTNLRYAGTTA